VSFAVPMLGLFRPDAPGSIKAKRQHLPEYPPDEGVVFLTG